MNHPPTRATMDDWFSVINARSALSAGAVQELHDVGFVVIPGPVPPERFAQFVDAYDLMWKRN